MRGESGVEGLWGSGDGGIWGAEGRGRGWHFM